MMDNMTAETKTIDIAKKVLVIGGGLVGMQTAKAIADQGYPVLLAAAGEAVGLDAESLPLAGSDPSQLKTLMEQAKTSDRIEILTQTELAGAAGMPGDFKVWLETREDVTEKQVGAIGVPIRSAAGSTGRRMTIRPASSLDWGCPYHLRTYV